MRKLCIVRSKQQREISKNKEEMTCLKECVKLVKSFNTHKISVKMINNAEIKCNYTRPYDDFDNVEAIKLDTNI